jgi:molybdenum cofactor biosynthesis enzyme
VCKALDPALTVNQIQLQQKTVGKFGLWKRDGIRVGRNND